MEIFYIFFRIRKIKVKKGVFWYNRKGNSIPQSREKASERTART
ncbi:hypothetical protein N568_0100720 [Lactococcus garvieae TRF1]|uniref:Uncharacterized protein n=2 Tax=Lactococcus garvieae TaxID=1363 RepID=F9VDR6_LACGL|nr:hypothetical protein N568_0100720 [Lactococcus garvieae TRF1]BAK58546.1 hypothetical protein LCGT_1033 [Lactococcus garvieae ATCC 49156]BAK60467.1 hypothetical protein LCGL_1007 [Lactococcus garvieae Lg2]